MDLLRWVDTLCKHMPGTSIGAFAQALQDFGPQVRLYSFDILGDNV